MADIHVQGASGNDTDNGTTWALANATLVGASVDAVAGDRVLCDAAETESNGGSTTITLGTVGSPCQILSGTPDVTTGITALSKGYNYTISGGSFATALNGFFYCFGIVFTCGSGSSTTNNLNMAQGGDNRQRYRDCDFILNTTSSGADINIGINSTQDSGHVIWENCGVKFGHASQTITVQNAELQWNGGSVLAGGTSPSALFGTTAGRPGFVKVTGVDLSNLASTFNFLGNPGGGGWLIVRGCKLPAAWSGTLSNGSSLRNWRGEMYDCDTANNGYVRFWIKDHFGEETQDTSVDRTGVGDGIADYSIKVVTSADAEFPSQPFITHEQMKWNSTTGASKTLTVELTSSGTLNTNDVVLRVRYFGSTTSPLMSEATSEPTAIASNAALTTSAVAWNNAQTNKYKLEVSFTPQRAGYVVWDVLVFKPSTTLYIAPGATIA